VDPRGHSVNAPGPLPYDLRVGVTGHRVLADEEAAGRAVDKLLKYIAATLDRASIAPLAWTVVSPLAKGADRIVADAVLARTNAKLHVITPLPLADYRTDFGDPADRRAFERLLARASSVQELGATSAVEIPTSGVGVVAAAEAEREFAYVHVGEHVVDACEILICIWNGLPARGVGGTADIVRYALQRERTVLWVHSDRLEAPARLLRSIAKPDVSEHESLDVRSEPLPGRAKDLSRGYHEHARIARGRARSRHAPGQ
jgi:hypothetical protein